jgi:DNA replication initiation complex subunit (GINS family)
LAERSEIHAIELRNAQNVLKDIYDRREKKLLLAAALAVRGGKVERKNMLSKEGIVFDKIVQILKTERKNLDKTLAIEVVEEPKPKEKRVKKPKKGFVKVKILQNLPSFLGINGKEYGPFKENDVVELPEANANALIEKARAKVYKEG